MQELKDTVVIYHDQCRDGFGAAYAAWKKLGNEVSYIARKTQEPIPDGLTDKTIFIVDYSYPQNILDELMRHNRSVVVIDHHETAREAVTAFEDNIFDLEHSGAVLAWQYFHPGMPVPPLLSYVEDHDLWKFALPHTREFGAALGEYTQDFETWDQLNKNFEDNTLFNSFIRHGEIIAGHEDAFVLKLLAFRERVLFEGHEVYAINTDRTYRSILGHKLAELNKTEGRIPLGIVYYRYGGAVHCSLRSMDETNVRTLAEKHGGGGHDHAASIRVPHFGELPFTFL